MLMSYVLDAGRNSHGMDALAESRLGHADHQPWRADRQRRPGSPSIRSPIDRATDYSAEDADVILRLWRVLKPRLVAEHMTTVYETLERPLIAVLARMERRGISIDRQVLSKLSAEFAQTAARLESEIQEIAGEPVNLGSPKQLGDILFGKMGLPGGSKTKTGAWSTTARVLDELAEQGHELPKQDSRVAAGFQTEIDLYRRAADLRASADPPRPHLLCAGRDHDRPAVVQRAESAEHSGSHRGGPENPPRFHRARRATSWSRRIIRRSSCGCWPQIADIAAVEAGVPDGLDIHAMTASEMFGVPIKDMPREVRRRAKAINFGIIYGISAFGLANQLGIAREEAAAYIKKYFERFPGIRAYMDSTRDFCREQRLCRDPVRAKMPLPRRQGIKRLDPRLQRARRDQRAAAGHRRRHHPPRHGRGWRRRCAEKKLSAQMLLQVHDELIFEVPDDEVAATLPVVQHTMQDAPFPAVLLSVPLHVDARAANNWDEAH